MYNFSSDIFKEEKKVYEKVILWDSQQRYGKALMASGALTACSGGSSSQTTAAQQNRSWKSSEAGEAVKQSKEDAGSGEGVTIRLVHYMGEQAKRDALDAILADFKKENPILMLISR